jgi:hypothetical protein
MKSPIVDVAAILICILAVVVLGQYYIHKKEDKGSIENVSTDNRVEKFKFETLVKQTD